MRFMPQNTSMLAQFPILLCACLAITTTSSPLLADESSDTPKITTSAENKALSIAPPRFSAVLPPADFTFVVASGGDTGTVPIANTDIFGLSIAALAALARAPPETHFAAKRYRIPRDPNIGLSLGGPGRGFDSKYMIWGLTLATKYMVDRSQFRNWLFTLQYRNQNVGQIWFIRANPPTGTPIEAGNTTDSREISQRTDLAGASSEIENLHAVPDIDIQNISGAVMTLNEVMMVIISGLSDVAFHDKSQRIQTNFFVTRFAPYRGRLTMSFPWPRLLSPAWCTWGFMLEVLQKLALWYFRERVYKPVRLLIRSDGAGGAVTGYGHLKV
ncbi:MAG: hypothetical protein Q9166_007942 [cf. Caloplaca sp. 2 TL-2023]